MAKRIRNAHGVQESRVVALGELIHADVREVIETAVQEELAAALSAARDERNGGRVGYRHGTKSRVLTGPTGPVELRRPRGRVDPPVGTPEWASAIVPRYQRRRRQVNETVVATCLAGGNMRRSRGALAPLLQAAPLSKSAVSRIVGTLTAALDAWQTRPLADVDVVYLYLDAIALRVRSGGKVVGRPVLGVVGVLADGLKQLLRRELCRGESFAAWKGSLDDLVTRGLQAPLLCIVDGPAAHASRGLMFTPPREYHGMTALTIASPAGNARCVIGSSPLARVLMLLCRHRKGRFRFSTRLGTLPG
jgi:putative transposase